LLSAFQLLFSFGCLPAGRRRALVRQQLYSTFYSTASRKEKYRSRNAAIRVFANP